MRIVNLNLELMDKNISLLHNEWNTAVLIE